MDGCRPSFDSITSEAFSCRAWVGGEARRQHALVAGLADGPGQGRRAERPHRRIALERDALDDERGAPGGIEADVGEEELLGPGGAESRRPRNRADRAAR